MCHHDFKIPMNSIHLCCKFNKTHAYKKVLPNFVINIELNLFVN